VSLWRYRLQDNSLCGESSLGVANAATPFLNALERGMAEGDSGFACWRHPYFHFPRMQFGGENNARQRLVQRLVRTADLLAAADALGAVATSGPSKITGAATLPMSGGSCLYPLSSAVCGL
jgi:hypothetical protein